MDGMGGQFDDAEEDMDLWNGDNNKKVAEPNTSAALANAPRSHPDTDDGDGDDGDDDDNDDDDDYVDNDAVDESITTAMVAATLTELLPRAVAGPSVSAEPASNAARHSARTNSPKRREPTSRRRSLPDKKKPKTGETKTTELPDQECSSANNPTNDGDATITSSVQLPASILDRNPETPRSAIPMPPGFHYVDYSVMPDPSNVGDCDSDNFPTKVYR